MIYIQYLPSCDGETSELDNKVIAATKQRNAVFSKTRVLAVVPVTATVVRGREISPDSDTPVSLTS